MYWTQLLPLIALACGILLVPGAALGAALGIRGIDLVLRAPLLSVGIAGVAAVVAGLMGLRWSVLTVLILAAVFVVLALVASAVARRLGIGSEGDRAGGPAAWWGLGGAVVGGALIAVHLKTGLINPDAISQSYDNIFHLNAVRYIADTGDGSSLGLLAMTSADGSGSFYPAAWHDLTALVFAVFPSSIPAATNAMTFAVTALAWPLSVVALALALRPRARVHALAAGVLAAGFIGFPGIVLKWGVLYPNMLGLAILPAYIAIVRTAVQDIERGRKDRAWTSAAQVLVGTAAVGLAHPNVLVSAAVILLPWGVWVAAGSLRSWVRGRQVPLVRPVLLAIVSCGAFGAWLVLRPGAENATWGPSLPSGQAVGEFLTQSFNGNPAQWAVTVLLLVGAFVAIRSRQGRWLVAAWLLTGFLWIVAVSWEVSPLRTLLTGPWYNDKFRLIAITVIPALFLAAAGASSLARSIGAALERPAVPHLVRQGAPAVLLLLTLAVTVSATSTRGIDDSWLSVAHEFKESPDSLLITSDEQAVLDAVDEYVPSGDTIVVDPWEGSSLAYALEDRQVTQRHSLSDTPPQYAPIVQHLDDPTRRAEVCESVERTGAHWYLDFDDTLDIGKDFAGQYEGLEDVSDAGVLTPVYVSGSVGLYRISACDG